MIYIAIPAHNEDRVLGVLLWKIRKVMAEFGRDYEIVVFDDASGDSTVEVLARYSGLLPLTVIRSEERLGYSGAVERLLRDIVDRSPYPKRDVVVTLQGDFTENPEDFVPMVKAIEGGVDLVSGVTDSDQEDLPRGLRILRRIAPYVLGSAHSAAPVTDPLSGYRACRVIVVKKALRELADGGALLTSDGWGANLQLLSRLVPHARRVEESPVRIALRHRERESRFRFMDAFRSLLRVRRTTWTTGAVAG